MIEIEHFRIERGLNAREHWAARSRRVKSEKSIVGWSLRTSTKPALPCVVKLTRVAPKMLDSDNNVGGMKAARDSVAEWLGIDDADPRVEWQYGQEQAKRYALRIEFA